MTAILENNGFITGTGGVKLFYRTWMPESPRGSLVLVHGMGEYLGRYEHVARFFVEQGLAVYGIDHRGHGRSEGVRVHVDQFDDYVKDLIQVVDMAGRHGKPIMLGHSMGGLIAFRYGLQYPHTVRALLLSSPMFRMRAMSAGNRLLASVLSRLAPKLQIPANIAPDKVCRDPDSVKQYGEDPLIGRAATPRWLWEGHKAYMACHQGLAAGMKLPVLFLQAGNDYLVDPDATRSICDQVAHGNKAFKLYPGLYHEIFNDPERDQVFGDIMNWLREQELVNT